MNVRRHRCLLVLLVSLALSAALSSGPAHAQSCTTDFQCDSNPSGTNVCLGDTLVLRRRLCLSGQCVEQEMGRVNCGGGDIGGTCRGNTFVRSGNSCDAAAGRCAQGSGIAIACVKSCSCTGRTLTISTGLCTPGSGCGRVVMRCKVGCTCAGEPRCTEDPPVKGTEAPDDPQAAEVAKALAAARAANELPPRWAEPFEAETPPRTAVKRATTRSQISNRKKRRR